MKRTNLYLIAILFVSAIALLFSTAHVFDERAAKPAFSSAYELEMHKNHLPRLHLPNAKAFFDYFAP